MVTIQCKACTNLYKIDKLASDGQVVHPTYCPECGHSDVQVVSPNEDWYTIMANEMDLTPQIIKEIYALWNPKTDQSFTEFVRQLKSEVYGDVKT